MDNARGKFIAAGLTLVVTAIVIVGFLSIDWSTPRRKNLPSIDIAQLAPGHFTVDDGDNMRYFVIRPDSDQLFVLAAPLADGAVPMPDEYWWRPLMRCKDFGIEPNDGIVRATSHFRCRDAEVAGEWAERWQWDIHGRHVAASQRAKVPDLYRVKIERKRKEVVLLALED